MLVFIGIRPGMTALDLSAAGGYTTELLARAIGPAGNVYGQSRPRDPSRRAARRRPRPRATANPSADAAARRAGAAGRRAAARRPSPWPTATAGSAERRHQGRADRRRRPAVRGSRSARAGDGSFDLVTLMFNYHDLGHLGVDRAAMNRAVFQALKPGGFYVIADHSGRPGTGISEAGTLHRVEEAFLRKEVEAAGFKLAAEGNFLRNPNDPRDKNTPDPPQPKDEFVLKFVKP